MDISDFAGGTNIKLDPPFLGDAGPLIYGTRISIPIEKNLRKQFQILNFSRSRRRLDSDASMRLDFLSSTTRIVPSRWDENKPLDALAVWGRYGEPSMLSLSDRASSEGKFEAISPSKY